MDLRALEGLATAVFLHVVRAGGFFAAVPLFGRQRDTAFVRLVLALALGAMSWWTRGAPAAAPDGVLVFGTLAAREAFVGLALGWAVGLMLEMVIGAGEIIGNEMGFSMARAINPESGIDSSVMSQMLQVTAFLLVLHFDLHHEALRVLQRTYDACPVGDTVSLLPIQAGLTALVGGSITAALEYALPVLGVMLLLTIGLVLLGRAVPQLNLMDFGFAARVLVALAAAAWFLADGTPFLVSTFRGFLDGAAALFPGR